MENFDIFILTLFKHGYKVRYSTIIHLLVGKRTSSVLTYGYFYQILPYVGLYPKLSEAQFKNSLNYLNKKGFLELSGAEQEYAQLTFLGKEYLAKDSLAELNYLNSYMFSRLDEEFYNLLLFASQVVSEANYRNKDYLPIETNPQQQAKIRSWFRRKVDRQKLSQNFFNEWQQFFELLPAVYRDGVSLLLSGHKKIGLTFQQLVTQEDWAPEKAYLIRKNYLHLLLAQIRQKNSSFPIFLEIFNLIQQPLSNKSAANSINLFLTGMTPLEISQQRQLKLNTIGDHLVEGAMVMKDFPFGQVLQGENLQQLDAYKTQQPDFRNWRYAQCSELIPNLTFIEFRLYQILSVRNEQDVTFK